MQTAVKKRPAPAPPRVPRRRRLKRGLLIALPCWLLLCWFVVRPRLERFLSETFEGEARVSFAIVWPHLDVTAFGLSVKARHHALSATLAHVDTRVLGLFGERPVHAVSVRGLSARFEEDSDARILRAAEGGGGSGGAPGAPARIPPLRFDGVTVELARRGGEARTLFTSERVDVVQAGESLFRISAGEGRLLPLPYERLTARLLPRGGRLLVDDLKVRALNGIARGYLDIDAKDAGAFNGEVEWKFVEIEEIWRTFGLPFAEKRRGDLSGSVVFEAGWPALAALKAKGSLRLERGRFYSPVSFKIFLVLGLPVLDESWIHGGEITFSVEAGLCHLEEVKVRGGDYALEGRGILAFTGEADLEMKHGGTTLAVSGPVEDPSVRVLPLSGLTVPFDRLFRERVRASREGE